MDNEIKNAALEYIEYGFSVIPIKPGTKKPLIAWAEYQSRPPTEEEVDAWFEQYPDAQLALVTGQVSGLAAIDLDGPVGIEWARQHIERPAVWQKTAKGSHSFYRSNGSPIKNGVRIADQVDIRGDGGYVLIEPSIHPETQKPYELHFAPDCTWSDLTPFPYDKIPQKDRLDRPPVTLDPAEEGSRNDTLARIAGRYISLNMDFAEVLALCRGWNVGLETPLEDIEVIKTVESIWKKDSETNTTNTTNVTQHDKTRQNTTKHDSDTTKHDSCRQQPFRFQGNLTAEIRQFVKENQGSFTSADIDREFGLTHRLDKQQRSRACKELEKEKNIRRDRRITGKFHILRSDISFISLSETEETPFPLELPLSLNKMVTLPKRCICVIAGTSNAGKTAFLMEILKQNMLQNYDLMYLMSEMGPSEYKQRVQRLDVETTTWEKRIKAASVASGFDGPITQHNPDGITAVDFLEEVEGEYAKIASDIRAIYDSLNDGIAWIALQKHSQAQVGRGGEGTTEKARLYLTLDKLVHRPRATISALKIYKAKDYPEENPNGKEIHIEIRGGHEITPISDWMYCNAKQREQWIAKYEHMVEQGSSVVETGNSEVVFRFALNDGSYGNLRERDYQKWKQAFPDVDVDEILSQMSDWTKRKKPLKKKGWFFQLANILKDYQKHSKDVEQ